MPSSGNETLMRDQPYQLYHFRPISRVLQSRTMRIATAVAAVIAAAPGWALAQDVETVKPYIVLILDVSGSMDSAVSGPPETCSGGTSRFDHARCAIQKLVNTHGDAVFALARFRADATGATCNDCDGGGIDCQACNESNGNGCTSTMNSPDRFELLVPLTDDNADAILAWSNFTCGGCGYDPAVDPEMATTGWTPIGGSLRGAQRYFQGADPFYATDLAPIYGAAPGDPIRSDPLRDKFLPSGEQCRPYIVISLTDGDETCEPFSGTQAAAASLLSTPVDVDGDGTPEVYRVQTKAIGFGKAPCDPQIEGIAHAGGAPDDGDPNTCEGFYAQNEEELSIAFNQIIADTLKIEVCNGIDDDCDGLIDEGFQKYCDKDGRLGPPTSMPVLCVDPGDDCDGVDDNCYMGTDDEPPDPSIPEVCDGVDNDCDGLVDEGGVCTGCGTPEVCDGIDNDCDGEVDEGLTRTCGFDLPPCTEGTETCVAGEWVGCDAVLPQPEVCDGIDNNCDGAVDGMSETCTDLPDPPGNPNTGVCTPGVHVCIDGAWGPCLGEVQPGVEVCDGLDNDCDGAVDEDIPSVECGTTCGVGMTECVDGELVCSGGTTSMPEECNGFDDDCDGLVDEDLGTMGPCDGGGTLCSPGELVCVAGEWTCVGGEPAGPEICDCKDNDCDGEVDEQPPALCMPGATCVACQCAFPCEDNEFPCPVGRVCVDGYCLVDRCYGVDCGPNEDGDATECVDGTCEPICDHVTCPDPLVCRRDTGECVTDDCAGFPERCGEGELCVAGECVADPCYDVACAGADEYCYQGDCVRSCGAVQCPAGQICRLGACEADPCAASPCGPAEVCDPAGGTCEPNRCLGVTCPASEACDPLTGDCGPDVCAGVHCPHPGEVCVDGTCYDPDQVHPPDAGPPPEFEYVSAGGGGCGCRAPGDGGSGGAGAWLVALVAAALRRRRGGRR
ncbi:MAG: VWA domain-containing protein [Deltaproteobacteria bacterium]|nr:MAG: VWA domain-containing protein [Deltaproteobacteria bacterium]